MYTRDVAVERVVSHQLVAQDPIDVSGGRQSVFPSLLCRSHFTLDARKSVTRSTELIVELRELRSLLSGQSRDERWRVDVFETFAALGDVVEEREHLVELDLLDRIELVVVATGAPRRQAEPNGRRRRDTIDRVLHQELSRHDPTFRVQAVIAVECGGDALIECCVG